MKVLILGCGWVGESFAEHMQAKGAELWVTCRTPEKVKDFKDRGYHACLLDFDEQDEGMDLPLEFDFVLNSVPATAKYSVDVLENRFRNLKKLLHHISYRKHIFLSSIGVYPDCDAVMDENYTQHLNPRLRDAEVLLSNLPNTLIYRLGGLFGKNRIFAKYFSNKVCSTGAQLANFVHVDDVLKLLDLGFTHLDGGEIYNIVCPQHPTKEDVVCASAAKYGYDLPSAFEPADSFQKKVLSTKISTALSYSFIYPSPLDF